MELPFGQWPLGLDNRNAPRRLNPAALARAEDVLIEDGGQVHSAQHPALDLASGALTSLWTSSDGASYALSGNTLHRIDGNTLIPVGVLDGSDEACFCEFAGRLYVGRRGGTLHQVQGAGLVPAALAPPALGSAVTVNGGLPQGRYGVCAARLRGDEEMPASALALHQVAGGGGVQVTVAGHGLARLFITEPNGTEPLMVADVPCGVPWLIGAGKRGQPPAARFLEPLPAGRFMAALNSRPPCDLRHNHMPLASPVTMLCAVEDGLYLADRSATWFIEGTDEDALRLKPLCTKPPPTGGFARLPGSGFSEIPDVPVAVWLSENGFVIGLPGAQVIEPQAARIRLPTAGLSGSLALEGRRLYALST